jgi:hypothetical protein
MAGSPDVAPWQLLKSVNHRTARNAGLCWSLFDGYRGQIPGGQTLRVWVVGYGRRIGSPEAPQGRSQQNSPIPFSTLSQSALGLSTNDGNYLHRILQNLTPDMMTGSRSSTVFNAETVTKSLATR